MGAAYHLRPCSWRFEKGTVRGSVHHGGAPESTWVVFLHGFTGQRMGPHYLYVRLAHRLLGAGISSLRFDFPGAGESDGDFVDLTLSRMIACTVHSVKQLRARYHPARVVLCGHSLGGCAAACAARSVGADALVLLAPVGNPQRIVRESRELLAKAPCKKGIIAYGAYAMKAEFLDDLAAHDPVKSLKEGFCAPLLVVQGDNDQSVSVREAARYIHWARKAGVRSEFVVLGNADHNFSSVEAIERIGNTLTDWVKGL